MHDLISLKVTNGIHASSSRTPHKVAVWYGDRSVTYKELTDRMSRVSYAAYTDMRFLNNAAIVGNNSIEYLEILLGLADVGVPVVTINPKSTTREVVVAIQDSNVKVLFIDEKLYKKEYEEVVDLVITIGPQYNLWLDQQKQLSKYPAIKDSTIFNIVYSSGTTGSPKGIAISHRSRLINMYTMAIDYRCMYNDDVMLCLASLSNGGGNATALATLNTGGTIVLGTQVHPDYIMRTIEKHKVSCMFIVPVLIHMLTSTPSCHKYDRSSLRGVFSSAAPFPATLKRKATKFFGDIVYDVYASTECGPVTVLKPSDFERGIHSVGKAVTGCVIEIRRDDGSVADMAEVGEIFAKNQSSFSGYTKNYADTKSNTLTLENVDNEFISAGDLGYIGWDGNLYLVGRRNDLIITGGNNVYPEEVESVINSCPGVVESAVIGTPDDRWGEIVTAYVVGVPTSDLFEHCKANLASFKIPRKIINVNMIPKSETGKILRKILRFHPDEVYK